MGKGSIYSITLSHRTVNETVGKKPQNKRWWRKAKNPCDTIGILLRIGTNRAAKRERRKDPAKW